MGRGSLRDALAYVDGGLSLSANLRIAAQRKGAIMALKDLVGRSDREQGSFGKSIPAPPRTVAPPTSIDASTELTGDLRCSETVRIDGKLKGKLTCEKSVIIGQGAKVEAVVTAEGSGIAVEVSTASQTPITVSGVALRRWRSQRR